MKILLLEDEAALSDIIAEYLRGYGYAVEQYFDGDLAFEAAYEKIYDLWLFDVSVPGMDGFELLRRLRHEGKDTPAIYITSHQKGVDVESGFEAGADDYLKKPFEMRELLVSVKNIRLLA
jgi:DNA-binding response OmpR family regulator